MEKIKKPNELLQLMRTHFMTNKSTSAGTIKSFLIGANKGNDETT